MRSNNILVLRHMVDGYSSIQAIFDEADDTASIYNELYKKYSCMNNYTFESAALWETVQDFINLDDSSYIATQLRRELDPEYVEYLRLKKKFEG